MELQNYMGNEPISSVFSLESTSLNRQVVSKEYFRKLVKEGILQGEFEDSVWNMTDGYHHKKLDFSRIKYHPRNMTKEVFILMFKMFICKKLKGMAVESVGTIGNKIIGLINETHGFAFVNVTKVRERDEYIIKEFLQDIGINDYELQILDVLEGKSEAKPRLLAADFWTYFVLDYELKEFWASADYNEKLIYGPLYIYWILGNIIPSRPEELCMLQRKCVSFRGGMYYISVPKSGIKGTGRIITNNRKTEDAVMSFRIDEQTAKAILWYEEQVEGDAIHGPNGVIYLFNNVTFNRITKQKQPRKLQFTETHLGKLKTSFLKLLEKKGYEVLDKFDSKASVDNENKWISEWCLGDLRHLALMNLIYRGVDPTIVMIFAGHCSITQTCHYACNFAEMNGVRLRFERRYRGDYREFSQGINIYARMLGLDGPAVRGGICLYNGADESKIQICAKYLSCAEDGCPYFYPNGKKLERDLKEELSQQIDRMMECFRKSVLHNEVERARDALLEIRRVGEVLERSEAIWEDHASFQLMS